MRSNPIYIVGAGDAGLAVLREIREKKLPRRVLAFLDDDEQKIGTSLEGIPVLGPIDEACGDRLEENCDAFIAMPAATRSQLTALHNTLKKTGLRRVSILPSLTQVMEEDSQFAQNRDIPPQELLGRDPVEIDLEECLSYVQGRRVLITGAGGSIGSELSRQLLHGGAERLYLLGHGENSIWRIEKELRAFQRKGIGSATPIVPIIGDLQDRDYMSFLLRQLNIDIVFHSAAHKHLPMMELNPVEAVKNNVFGTWNLIEAIEAVGNKRLVLISTDKAVEPSCIYGITKKIAELMVLGERQKGCDFLVVRFGNVLGSRGSIIPLFKEQIMAGGPVTITHPDARRWFMTIPEAVSLVLMTAGLGTRGGLYFLDMGEPVKILDIAKKMIAFYGYDEKTIPISFIGLRSPGEKTVEQLWTGSEAHEETFHPRIRRVRLLSLPSFDREKLLENLLPVCFRQEGKETWFRNKRILHSIISDYFPQAWNIENVPEY